MADRPVASSSREHPHVPFLRSSAMCTIGAALVLARTPLAAQHCVIPGTVPTLSVRAGAGAELGGEGYAAGGSLALHGQRWFVAGEFADRGWGLGRRTYSPTYSGLSRPGIMERQHQVLGLRAGGARALGTRSALCASLAYASGTGLRFVSSGDPQVGGVGFTSHHRVRGDIEAVRAITLGNVRLLPALSVGLLLVAEEEIIQGDIIVSGPSRYVPITMMIGVPIGRHLTLRPRFNVPRGDARGTSYGIDASVQMTSFR
jgi:hypothetical protein